MKQLAQVKLILRENPYSIIWLPHLWGSVLNLILMAIWNRLKYTQQTVYFSEADIESIVGFIPHSKSLDEIIIRIDTETEAETILRVRNIQDDYQRNSQLQNIIKRLERGDSCYVLYYDNMPVSYLWVAVGFVNVETIDGIIHLSADSFAIYDVYTSAPYRGKGFYKSLLQYIMCDMSNKGFSKSCLWVMKHNKTAIQTQYNCGFQKIKTVISYKSLLGVKCRIFKTVNYKMIDLLT